MKAVPNAVQEEVVEIVPGVGHTCMSPPEADEQGSGRCRGLVAAERTASPGPYLGIRPSKLA